LNHSEPAPNWETALDIVVQAARVKEVETLDITSAVGRTLASSILASTDFPAFNRSSVDGFALRSTDVASSPTVLRIAGTITAGTVPKEDLQSGQCMRVMTGAAIPIGADAVVPAENVVVRGGDIEVGTVVKSGYGCTFQGAEYSKGAEVIASGTQIGASEVGLMAEIGIQQTLVHKAPTVALIVTGDELVEPWVNPRPGQIRNSNAYTLLTLFRQVGVSPHYLGICPDSLPALSEKILSGMQDDLVVVVGGSASGDKDYLREVLGGLGMEILIDGARFKPGGTFILCRRKTCLVMGLPGPPGATRTVFHLLLHPLLRKMMGSRKPIPTLYSGVLKGSFAKPEGVEFFLGVKASFVDDRYVLEQTKGKSTESWKPWKSDDALVRIPQDVTEVKDGERVRFLFTNPCME